MMTDREILERAAKAAGINGTCWISSSHSWFKHEGIGYNDDYDCQQVWNPLIDDGDALKLVSSLGLYVNSYPIEAGRTVVGGAGATTFEYHGSNAEDATRRAIVRCAAESLMQK